MFDIRIADLNIRIENCHPYLEQFCVKYRIDKTTSETDCLNQITGDSSVSGTPDISVSISDEEIQSELAKGINPFMSEGYAESIVAYEKISCLLPAFNAFVMHSSVISLDGQAFCFAAKCGVGKSTHTRFWKELYGDRVIVINGDKPIYRFDGDKLMAYGTPWCGKEGWNTNTKAPLKALCLLERGEENKICPVDGFQELGAITNQFYLPGNEQVDILKMFDLIDQMIHTVKVYRLSVKNEISAAKTAAEELSNL